MDKFSIAIVVVVLLVLTFAFYSLTGSILIDESPGEVEAGTVSVDVANMSISHSIAVNEASLIELSNLISAANSMAMVNTDYKNIVDILQIEYSSIAVKNEQLKSLQLDNQEIAHDAGIITTENSTMSVEGLDDGEAKSGSQSVTEKNTRHIEIPGSRATADLGKMNDIKQNRQAHKKFNLQETLVKSKRKGKTLDEVNAERIRKGRKPINADKINERRAALIVRKEQRRMVKAAALEALEKWKVATDPVEKAAAKATFLLVASSWKNGKKSDFIEDIKLVEDETLISGGTTATEVIPAADAVSVIEENAAVADDIDAEIIIKQKIILDAATAINEAQPADTIFQDISSKVLLEPEMSTLEMLLIDELVF